MVPKEIWSGKGLDELFKIVLPPLFVLLSYNSCILITFLFPLLDGGCARRPSMSDPTTIVQVSVSNLKYTVIPAAGSGSLSTIVQQLYGRVLHITVLCVLYHHTSLHQPTDSQYINVVFPTVFSHFYHVTGRRD